MNLSLPHQQLQFPIDLNVIYFNSNNYSKMKF